MAQGKPQLKFERNPCNNFRDNRCHRRTDGRTDGRQTTDGWTTYEFWFHELCWHSQAELKINNTRKRGVVRSPCYPDSTCWFSRTCRLEYDAEVGLAPFSHAIQTFSYVLPTLLQDACTDRGLWINASRMTTLAAIVFGLCITYTECINTTRVLILLQCMLHRGGNRPISSQPNCISIVSVWQIRIKR